jgi:hypothetical protein
VSVFGGDEIVCRRRRQKCAGVHVCENVDPLLLKDRRELNPKSLEDVIKAQFESRVTETDSTAKRTLMYLFSVLHKVLQYNIQLDSFPLYTQSLATVRNQMGHNVMDIRF